MEGPEPVMLVLQVDQMISHVLHSALASCGTSDGSPFCSETEQITEEGRAAVQGCNAGNEPTNPTLSHKPYITNAGAGELKSLS